MKNIYTLLIAVTAFICCSLTISAQTLAPTPELLFYRFEGTGISVPNLASAPPSGTTTAAIMGGITQGAGGLCGGALIGTGNPSSTDYLNTGWAPNLTGSDWTISMYTKDITASSTLFYIFGDVNSGSFRCFTNGVAGANNWILRGGFTDVLVSGGATVAPHVTTFVYSSTEGNIKGYLDGVLVNTVTQAGPTISGTGPLKVMGYNSNVGSPAGGKLDDFRVYNRALSAEEVLLLQRPADFTSETVTSCDLFTTAGGDVYTTSGIYNDTVTNIYGCDSVITYDLTITHSSSSTISPVACDTYTAPDGAIYTTSGTYTAVIQNSEGCDSTITVNLTINNSSTSTISPVSCDSYTAPDGATYTTSGNYTAVITNEAGCDSTITINLTINSSSTSTITETVCDSYTAPDGATYTTSGTYIAVLTNATGCDSTITINLTVNNSTSSSITETVCDTYTAPDGAVYTTSGTYTAVLSNTVGCDSTITINLTVNNSTTSNISETACDSYTAPDGATYSASGTYTAVIANASGCDSTITINLTINNSTTSTITETVCNTYTAPDGATYVTTGTYTAVITNTAGCDSTITINLTVNNSTTHTLTVVNCGAYTSPAGNVYTTSGTYTDVITNSVGCDSNITINLTVNSPSSSVIQATGCGSYLSPAGNTYTASGSYTEVITNATGCDSTITINLTIINVDKTVSINGSTLTANDGAATYEWLNCDNNTSTGVTTQSFTPTATGNYAVALNSNGCIDTSDCTHVIISSIANNTIAANSIIAFPNPTNSQVTLNAANGFNKATLKLTSLTGQVVRYVQGISGTTYTLNMDELTPAIYIVWVTQDGATWQTRIVKN